MNVEAIVGVSSGTFFSPNDVTSDSVIVITDENGGENNRFEWGIGVEGSFSSVLQFDGGDLFGAKPDEPFKIGQIFYQNGTIDRGTGFDGEFAFSVDLDIDGTDNDPDPFVYLFDIFNTPNVNNDPVLDADELQFIGSGFTPQTFELNGDTYTLELLGFSQDGGDTFTQGFESPEEGFDIANLYGRLIQISSPQDPTDPTDPNPTDPPTNLNITSYTTLEQTTITEIQAFGGIFIGGSNGPVAGSVIIDNASQLNTLWSINVGASFSFSSETTFEITSTTTTTIDLDALDITAAIGSDGDDSVDGSGGNDAVDGGDGDDMLEGNDGNDVLMGSDGDDTLMGGDGIDCVYGNRGDDFVSGGAGNDVVRGGKGNDVVLGDDGDDILSGDSGFDILTGGSGKDVFIVQTTFDETEATFSADLLTDFEAGEDTIALTVDVALTFEVGDFNADGTDDVGIKLAENDSFIAFVLNTDSTTDVENSIFTAPQNDFALI